MVIGIDASSATFGGGRVYCIELLKNWLSLEQSNFKLVVFGPRTLLSELPSHTRLEKYRSELFEGGVFYRVAWQLFCSFFVLRRVKCNLLFVTGGFYVGAFRPFVVVNQNLLPFDEICLSRYSGSALYVKYLVLKHIQLNSIRRSNGVIFLTDAARRLVASSGVVLPDFVKIVSHGLNSRFKNVAKRREFSPSTHKIRVVYPSTLDLYKNQDVVIEAVSLLRKEGVDADLYLIGPSTRLGYAAMVDAIAKYDPSQCWVNYVGEASYHDFEMVLGSYDVGIWASSCETFGMVLLEMMAVGLPVAVAESPAAVELTHGKLKYFNSRSAVEAKDALKQLITNDRYRFETVNFGIDLSKCFSWNNSAQLTFEFLMDVLNEK